ncbi:aminotransferase class I/II-fold pyridoxal phosphate-dependent enzyme [Limosilactobacillus mucosae]|uniref:aminotransferase class I/II-fold pyridoxal phosphate-dependent enzyme n=1 Tax=Limosilactobacillus mucosae TaxID=97478 RepID=UPI00233ECFB0|nr:aminotransferase class I/II-fold pyridoxal phosphate-dependent enzyme [Limosilactobacillus mucosae]MDC2844223.1 aminotransferase class I/II-fold pyridoxal phosphate-dependent enzyme [Limosilactobacillus mucosae]MDD6893278.1 aminotransferase class I/II-fold pyridoxal phosphate-dependent enzyme [Lactobacillus sp.]MDF9443613.1 aminotransferase class I/II-fold pyridoxal phosphate-dependent enzyme [Limosilactobacillus mucosae]
MSKIASLVPESLKSSKPSLIRVLNNKYGSDPEMVNLTVGEPDFKTADHVKLAAIKSILDDHTHYPHNWGTPGLRNAISQYLARHFDLHYDPEGEIFVTEGASGAISTIINGLCEPGDVVLVPCPAYTLYRINAELCNAQAVELETSAPDFKVTPQLLKEALDKYGDKVKVLVLNYPVNPTGVTYTPDELRALADLLKNYNVAILDDEIYADLLYEGEHLSMAKLLPDQTLYVNGVSKNAAMTGWRVGYICGPRDVLKALAKVHQAAISTNATMNMDAAQEALLHGDEDTAKMKAEYDRRRKFLMAAMDKIGFEYTKPKGAFYLWVKIPDGFDGDSMAYAEHLAEKAKVAVVPAAAFTKLPVRYFRISYAASMEKLQKAVDGLAKVFAQDQAD